jgi:hypothetical protein
VLEQKYFPPEGGKTSVRINAGASIKECLSKQCSYFTVIFSGFEITDARIKCLFNIN